MVQTKQLLLCLTLAIFATSSIFAQDAVPSLSQSYQKSELGILLGVSNYQGDLDKPDLFRFSASKFSYGFVYRYHLSDKWALRGNLLLGKIIGDDSNYTEPAWRKQRAFSFTASMFELTGQAEFEPWGHRRYENMASGRFKRTISPYGFVGLGFAAIANKTDYNDGNPIGDAQLVALDKEQDKDAHFVIPIGAGLKIDLSPSWTIGAEAGFRYPFSDYLDGVSAAGNPDKNDWYIVTGLTASYRFGGGSDRDNDGIPDSKDKCPDEPGARLLGGCPDRIETTIDVPRIQLAEADRLVLAEAAYGIQFETGSFTFKSESYPILENVLGVMQRYPKAILSIAGHTDNTGGTDTNQVLSEKRAKACYDWLMSKGIDASRMNHEGFGQSSPVAENTTPEGRSKNRRVAFVITN